MTILSKTYLNIINKIRMIGYNHKFIKTTTVGDIYDIDLSKESLFPLMHVNPVNVTTGQSQLTYNFQIFVCDLVSEKSEWETISDYNKSSAIENVFLENLSNEIDVYNDTLQTCVDLVSIFRNSKWQSVSEGSSYNINNAEYFTEGDYTFEPFTEKFDNELTGWVFNLNITVHNSFQTCDIPM